MDEAYKQQLHQEIENATVKILIGDTFKGTGFFISPDGYVLTAYHCIGPYPPEIWVETRFDGKYLAQLETDKSLLASQYDIAVLRIFNYRPSHYVPLGFVSQNTINDAVVAIGYPAGQYRLYEGKIFGVEPTTLASDVIRGEGQSGGLVYHYRTQRVVGLASAIFKREVIVNEGLAVRFETLFRKWSELEEINQSVATIWDKRLQRLSQGKQEKPVARPKVSTPPVKPKTSWAKRLGLVVVLGLTGVVSYGLYHNPPKPQPVADTTPKIAPSAPEPKPVAPVTTPSAPVEKPPPSPVVEKNKPSPAPVAVNCEQPGAVFQDTLKDGSLGPKMVVIPAGKFQMGDIQGTGDDDEKPVHWVEIAKPFAMGQYEVTRGEFRQFIKATGYETKAETMFTTGATGKDFWKREDEFTCWYKVGFAQEDTHPVVYVSWNDAVAYTEWLSQQTGHTYRLPVEAEWEYAARAGTKTDYWWGNTASHEYANYGKDQCCEGLAQGKDRWVFTSPVGSFKANPFGLYDTVGNVWEWTCSTYTDSYAGQELQCSNNEPHVLRGGSWSNNSHNCRAADRDRHDGQDDLLGFRVLMLPPC